MFKNIRFCIASLIFLFSLATQAAADPPRNYFGGQFGFTFPTSNSTFLHFQENLGFEVSSESHFYVGQFLSYSLLYVAAQTVFSVGPEFSFRGLFDTGFFLGAKAGIGYSSGIGAQTGGFAFMGGPILGYDFIHKKEGRKYGLGAEVFLYYLSQVSQSGLDSSGNPIEQSLPSRLGVSIAFALKLFF